MHIAVIGTGIVGVCCAAWLQRDGHTVTFVDPREAGEACSFIETEIPKWASIIKAGNVTLQ